MNPFRREPMPLVGWNVIYERGNASLHALVELLPGHPLPLTRWLMIAM
jgi:hypothetical protein